MDSVPASDLIARSPICPFQPVRQHRGWEVSGARGTGVLDLIDLSPLTKVLVRSAPGSGAAGMLACPFGRTRRDREATLVVGSGPDEWLLLAPVGTWPSIVDRLVAGVAEFTSVIDATHGGFLVRLTGANSNLVLAMLCAIDLSDRSTPDGSVFRSSVARIVCEVVRDDVQSVRSYLLHGDRSFGPYIVDTLLEVGAEFSIGIAGYPKEEI